MTDDTDASYYYYNIISVIHKKILEQILTTFVVFFNKIKWILNQKFA